MAELNLLQKLQTIQSDLIAPKNLTNNFGHYNYRNAEGILEAVKPHLKKHGVVLSLSDEIIQIGERYYIKATATVTDCKTGEKMETSALARESETKKGMDDSQITGTASSYARKYALNGLFILDDTKDADTDEYHEQTNRDNKKKTSDKTEVENLQEVASDGVTREQCMEINKELERTGVSPEKIYGMFKVKSLTELTQVQFTAVMRKLKVTPDKVKEENKK